MILATVVALSEKLPLLSVSASGESMSPNMKVKVIVDRPLGSFHPQYKDLYYPINYGYVPNILAKDGEPQDAYILGLNEPVETFEGEVIAVIHRLDDIEDKWVVANKPYSLEEIRQATHFQEQYFHIQIEPLK